jgi:hypothetical protein
MDWNINEFRDLTIEIDFHQNGKTLYKGFHLF